MEINIINAKTQLSKPGKLAWQGDEIIITKAEEPYLLLEPFREQAIKHKTGVLKGRISVPTDFYDTS